MIYAILLGIIAGMVISRFYSQRQVNSFLTPKAKENNEDWTADQYYWTMKKIQEENRD